PLRFLAEELASRLLERGKQSRSPRGLETVDAILEIPADLADVGQRHHRKRLTVETDHGDAVAVFQVVNELASGVAREGDAVLIAHAARLVDDERHGVAWLLSGALLHPHRQGLLDRRPLVSPEAEASRTADHREAGAGADPLAEIRGVAPR